MNLLLLRSVMLACALQRKEIDTRSGADVSALRDLLASEAVTLEPLFGVSEERIQEKAASIAAETGAEVLDLSVYYHVEAPDERLDDLAERLLQMEGIEAAYVKPPAEPAVFRLDAMAAQTEEPRIQTPDFTSRQGYLGPAVVGIDANNAWTIPGGGGAGVNIIDTEWGWIFTHEDLIQNQGGVVWNQLLV